MDNGGAFTQRLLDMAAPLDGLRVLDIGCGVGDVALRVADAVGPSGQVTGIDRNAEALSRARERAESRGNVTFVNADLGQLPNDLGAFDLVTCRRVLMYVPDTQAAMHAMKRRLRPGGRVMLHEHDRLFASDGDFPLRRRIHELVWRTVEAEGADISTGIQLPRLLTNAGFSRVTAVGEAVIQTPNQPDRLPDLAKAMLPRMIAKGLVTEEALDVDTLSGRLAEEMTKSGGAFMSEIMHGVIATAM